MKSELNDFISLVRTKGLLTSSHFYVFIPNVGEKDLMMLCDATSIPGMNLMTTETRIFGEITETPHSILYAPVTLSFYIDREMTAKKDLDRWMNSVFDRDTRTLGFYDNYTREVDIFLTDKTGETVYCHRLHEAYPKSIGDIQLSYSGDTVLKVDVVLSYKWSSMTIVSTSGEAIVTNQGNLATTDPFNPRTFGQRGNKPSSLNVGSRNEFDLNPSSLGNNTGLFDGGLFSTNNPATGLDVSLPFRDTVETYGGKVRSDFGRASNILSATMGASGIESSLANQMIIGSKSIARDMGNYASGLSELSNSLNNIASPISNITTSMFSLGNSLSVVNNALNIHGLGSPFTNSISSINRRASTLASVSTLAGIPGQLSGFGSALSSTGAIFNETVYSLRNVAGYNEHVESAVRNMGSTFITGGSETQNLAAELNSRVASGEIYDN